MDKNQLRREWEQRIADYRASGLTRAQWCRQNGLKDHQLKYWIKRIEGSTAQSKSSTTWASVVMVDSPSHEESFIQVKIGGCSIEVKQGFNPSLFADVVKVLKSLC